MNTFISKEKILSIAVVMTCFNRREKTIQCLQNLYEQKGINTAFDIKVFLVDDGSTDGTSDAVMHYFPLVNIIKGNGNLFWNRGMHKAWQSAKEAQDFDYYLWLNDDTNIKDDAVSEMLEVAILTNNNAIVCGAICSRTDNLYTYGGRTRNGKEIHPNGQLQYCHTINGNCVLVSKTICDRIGILDPVYPHAIGDYEYGLRALKFGLEIVTTRKFVGFCEKNPKLAAWCYSEVPLRRRIKTLYSPLGSAHPYYFFRFENKYYGFFTAAKHFFSIHLRALIPGLWKQ